MDGKIVRVVKVDFERFNCFRLEEIALLSTCFYCLQVITSSIIYSDSGGALMGLIPCPDCGNMVSDRVAACPNCGCPADAFYDSAPQENEEYYVSTRAVLRWMETETAKRKQDRKRRRYHE